MHLWPLAARIAQARCLHTSNVRVCVNRTRRWMHTDIGLGNRKHRQSFTACCMRSGDAKVCRGSSGMQAPTGTVLTLRGPQAQQTSVQKPHLNHTAMHGIPDGQQTGHLTSVHARACAASKPCSSASAELTPAASDCPRRTILRASSRDRPCDGKHPQTQRQWRAPTSWPPRPQSRRCRTSSPRWAAGREAAPGWPPPGACPGGTRRVVGGGGGGVVVVVVGALQPRGLAGSSPIASPSISQRRFVGPSPGHVRARVELATGGVLTAVGKSELHSLHAVDGSSCPSKKGKSDRLCIEGMENEWRARPASDIHCSKMSD